ncbi:MAG: tetratricopeptide repeat protein [Kiloniellales bacterium]
MADIFKEVDEELRRDNLAKLWKKYGRAAIGLALAIVLAVAGVQGWRAYDLDRRGTLSDRYGAALDLAQGGDTAAGLNGLIDLSEPDAGGYAGLAAFEEARLRVASGDTQGAIRVWDQIAADSGLGQGFRNVAAVLSVMHQIDSGDATVLRGRLEPLAGDGAPFRATARELLALIALRQGDRAGARELYTRIADDREAPSGLRARAAQMLAALKD